MKLLSDNSLNFYIELRKSQAGVTDSQLCITTTEETAIQTVENQSSDQPIQEQTKTVEELVLQIHDEPFNQQSDIEGQDSNHNYCQYTIAPNMFSMAEQVADFIIEQSNSATKKRMDEEMEIITVTLVTTILHQVNVVEKGKFLVNLLDKTCECNRFQQDEILCDHAIAVSSKRGL
ncbi:hypothetical protein F8388_019888 [Cannabis sativa]|uniref:SWIM-type domain-containing protein n=1 Tax=Cannabis sativa TaxID=3483 RepID=A0A7J6H4T4_CANSA|nr:hypothetical protein F8388_019888 [Cannabis sativa]